MGTSEWVWVWVWVLGNYFEWVWVWVWVRVLENKFEWVWVWVRVIKYGYGYGYGYLNVQDSCPGQKYDTYEQSSFITWQKSAQINNRPQSF